jgi:hypothetical protein
MKFADTEAVSPRNAQRKPQRVPEICIALNSRNVCSYLCYFLLLPQKKVTKPACHPTSL